MEDLLSTTGLRSTRGSTRGRWLAGSIVALVLVLASCGSDRASVDSPTTRQDADDRENPGDPFEGYVVGSAGTFATGFDSLHDLVDQSDIVAVVEVAAQRRGSATAEQHGYRTTQRVLEVVVQDALKGTANGDRIDVWDADIVERSDAIGAGGSLLVTTDEHALEVGDRVLVGLNSDEREQFSGLHGLQSESAFFIVDRNGESFVPIDSRSNPAAEVIDAMTLSEVVALIQSAVGL